MTLIMIVATIILISAFEFKIIGAIHLVYFLLRLVFNTLLIFEYQGYPTLFDVPIEKVESYVLTAIIYWSILKVLGDLFILGLRIVKNCISSCVSKAEKNKVDNISVVI